MRDGFELDVRKTADGQLVVIHPSVVGHHSVQSSSYDDIRRLPDGFEIPLLQDVLIEFGKKTFLDIEAQDAGLRGRSCRSHHRARRPGEHHDLGVRHRHVEQSPRVVTGAATRLHLQRTQDEELRHNAPIDYVIPQFKLASRELDLRCSRRGTQGDRVDGQRRAGHEATAEAGCRRLHHRLSRRPRQRSQLHRLRVDRGSESPADRSGFQKTQARLREETAATSAVTGACRSVTQQVRLAGNGDGDCRDRTPFSLRFPISTETSRYTPPVIIRRPC